MLRADLTLPASLSLKGEGGSPHFPHVEPEPEPDEDEPSFSTIAVSIAVIRKRRARTATKNSPAPSAMLRGIEATARRS